MKLALLGYPISHSRSPELYRKFLGEELEGYDLIAIKPGEKLPTLEELSLRYNGVNITAPYKKSYMDKVFISLPEIKSFGGINTILLNDKKFLATNTDYLAAEYLIQKQLQDFSTVFYIILGSGVMAKMTQLILDKIGQSYVNLSRSNCSSFGFLNLENYFKENTQVIVINACSRDYVFKGKLHPSYIFWDFNYSFVPHEKSIPDQVSYYQDGFDLLERQALFAIEFWKNNS